MYKKKKKKFSNTIEENNKINFKNYFQNFYTNKTLASFYFTSLKANLSLKLTFISLPNIYIFNSASRFTVLNSQYNK